MQTEKQMERLVELLLKCDKESEVLDCFNERPKKTQSAELIADYLMSNNVVVLPCKVGDTVYYINEYYDIYLCKDTIYEAKVARMVITKNNEISLVIHIKDESGLTEYPNVKNFGKTVFLSREEAENVLKERKNEK